MASPGIDAPRVPSPLFGMPGLLSFLRSPSDHMTRHVREFGPVYCQRFAGSESTFLLGPDANEIVFMNKDRAFATPPVWERQIGRYFRGGLLLRDFEEHRAHRLLLQPGFTETALRGYVTEMEPIVARNVRGWGDEARWPRRRLLAFRALKSMTLEVAAGVFLGERDASELRALNTAFLDAVRASGPGVLNPFAIPHTITGRGVAGRRVLERYFEARIASKRRSSDHDLFALLARGETRGEGRLTATELVDHLIFLLMAAHDTSTFTSAVLFFLLGKHPDWQARCRAEVRALGDGPLTPESLDRLPLLDYALKEALRLLPPLPYTGRAVIADVDVLGVRLRAGQEVAVSPLYTHHLPELYPDPSRFDPMRFAPGREEHRRHRFGYLPFGAGVHKCLGMRFAELELRTIFVHALRAYAWSVPANYEMPVDYTSLPVPADGLPIRIERIR